MADVRCCHCGDPIQPTREAHPSWPSGVHPWLHVKTDAPECRTLYAAPRPCAGCCESCGGTGAGGPASGPETGGRCADCYGTGHDGPCDTPGPPFPARYPGRCSGCGDPIHDGDMIRHAGTPGAYTHEECT